MRTAEHEREQFTTESSYLRPPATAACAVCMDSLSNGDNITRLSCQHYFHRQCIDEWGLHNNTCPICRGVVPTLAQPLSLRATGQQYIRVSYAYYRPPRALWIDQLKELIKALFFNGDR
ncbi:putative transcription factor C2H2 family [Helianthus annuus]|uniref:Putative zinc finger, RING/FYVE/PHD-type n=1 Tax=Helianthus annuus TaxID=4232 RepID=A0A251TCQ6_HELAN|nr:putative transcription factor C2H2 family [Helianthus annuus]KAJ0518632.1 putative transcription factor C2H2 family [Helianthus annuus]KAJ0735601.1 putative transcription factor C2H2 family [Helianthus annuus]KAJ0872047.1 putative transcription factor C2H2 family [Helianthus annuus]KAJ0876438.1 putative transcription factor C2H2 family [Helianthus annuus]